MRSFFLFIALFILGIQLLPAQGTTLPLGTDAYHIIDRLDISSGISAPFFTSLKYYTRGDVAEYALTLDTASDSAVESP
ncbi:MAG: hypothetical protein IPJ40_17700 [Saprospirales bacterium]|nr:hypothetical protein [Saprospirales bacterium]